MPILEARGLTKRFGGLVAVDGVDLAVEEGQVKALIGPNGAGKSTLFKMLSGDLPPTLGSIYFRDEEITALDVAAVCRRGISKSYQTTEVFPHLTVRENILIPALARTRGGFKLDVFRRLAAVPGLAVLVERTMDAMGLADRAEMRAADLAYGEKRRLEIGLALATEPRVLLLDEPTAGMSPEETRDVVRLVKELRTGLTIVIVEHDMDVVFELADLIAVMHEGRKIAEGPPAVIRENPAVQEAYLGGVRAP